MSSSGPILGKYEIVRRLGAGGMGEVFLAKQVGIPGFERHVILKSLLPSLVDDFGSVDNFLDEARVAANLNHPNVVAIYEVGQWEGAYYIAMEHIHGADLAELMAAMMRRRWMVPWPIAVAVARDAALGLQHAHTAVDVHGRALNIVHRDISPTNIMVRHDGVTKVVDFGIAHAANRVVRTLHGEVRGKLAYMSPEQLLGEALDGRADQFALGVVLWELCAGRRLFKADSEEQIVKNVATAPIPALCDLVQGCPPELDEVLARMLQRHRDHRFPTCQAAAVALRKLLASLEEDPPVEAWVRETMGAELDARVQPKAQPLVDNRPKTEPFGTPSVGTDFADVAATTVDRVGFGFVPSTQILERADEEIAADIEDLGLQRAAGMPMGPPAEWDEAPRTSLTHGRPMREMTVDQWEVPVSPPSGSPISPKPRKG